MKLAWFDRWLKGEDNGADSDSTAYYFTMGANVWRSAEVWPPEAQEARYFLHSGGKANTHHGNGFLSLDVPSECEASDHYIYDPMNPVPTNGGAVFGTPGILRGGVQEQRIVEARQDVLVYTSPPLEKDMEVTGNVTVRLWAATSAADTDWTAKLTDVHPDGSSYGVCGGIL